MNPQSRLIERFQGVLPVDTGLRRRPLMKRGQAVQRTLSCLEAMGQWRKPLERYSPEGYHTATVYYRPWGATWTLQPWWSIGIQRNESEHAGFAHEFFWVAPDGAVTPQGYSSHYSYERCWQSVP